MDERDDLSDLVVRDPAILSGTPVFRGTRIPVYDVAASAEKGLPIERILRAYPELTERHIDWACRWATANPSVEGPRVRTHNQYATVTTMWTAAMKLVAERS